VVVVRGDGGVAMRGGRRCTRLHGAGSIAWGPI